MRHTAAWKTIHLGASRSAPKYNQRSMVPDEDESAWFEGFVANGVLESFFEFSGGGEPCVE